MIFLILQISISKVEAIMPTDNEIFDGIDVSKWKGNIDFAKVANDGIKIVYIKATEGTNYISPTFEEKMCIRDRYKEWQIIKTLEMEMAQYILEMIVKSG